MAFYPIVYAIISFYISHPTPNQRFGLYATSVHVNTYSGGAGIGGVLYMMLGQSCVLWSLTSNTHCFCQILHPSDHALTWMSAISWTRKTTATRMPNVIIQSAPLHVRKHAPSCKCWPFSRRFALNMRTDHHEVFIVYVWGLRSTLFCAAASLRLSVNTVIRHVYSRLLRTRPLQDLHTAAIFD